MNSPKVLEAWSWCDWKFNECIHRCPDAVGRRMKYRSCICIEKDALKALFHNHCHEYQKQIKFEVCNINAKNYTYIPCQTTDELLAMRPIMLIFVIIAISFACLVFYFVLKYRHFFSSRILQKKKSVEDSLNTENLPSYNEALSHLQLLRTVI